MKQEVTFSIEKLSDIIHRLIGAHRQLLDSVRQEREALINANLTLIQEQTYAKEVLIESIRLLERDRIQVLAELSIAFKKPLSELQFTPLIVMVQNINQAAADKLRSYQLTLQLLIDRIREQNTYNHELIQKSLVHVQAMKNNVLGEKEPRAETYSAKAQKQSLTAKQPKIFTTEI